MIFIEILWENFDVKEGGTRGTLNHDLRIYVPSHLSMSYRSDNGTEAFEIVYTVDTVYTVEFKQW